MPSPNLSSEELLFNEIAGPCKIPARKTVQIALSDYLAKYPKDEQWRLLVDGKLYRNIPGIDLTATPKICPDPKGWKAYEEREPGAIKAYFVAWKYCLRTIAKQPERTELTADFLIQLRRLVGHKVKNIPSNDNGFRSNVSQDEANWMFGTFMFMKDNCYCYTVTGFTDLIKSIADNKLGNAGFSIGYQYAFKPHHIVSNLQTLGFGFISYLYNKMLDGAISYHAPHDNIDKLVEISLKQYNSTITLATTDDQKLEIIGNTIQQLERIHPFSDCNGRVIVNLLLNFLLIKEGFPPATFFEPNVFDAFGHLVDVIKKGIANTIEIYNGNRKLFGFENNESVVKNEMSNMMKDAEREFEMIAPVYDPKLNLFGVGLSKTVINKVTSFLYRFTG